MPSGRPRPSASKAAHRLSSSVAGMRLAMTRETGSRLRYDTPNSPCSARPRKSRYCTGSGASSPSLTRKASFSACVAVSPTRLFTGSPMKLKIAKQAIGKTLCKKSKHGLVQKIRDGGTSAVSFDGDQPQAQLIIRRLAQVDTLLRRPDHRLLMQRNM